MGNTSLDILAVDDDTVTRTVLADGLGVDGHNVSTAKSCAQAHRMLGTRSFDLVLLDLNLPDASGYALLREIRDGGPRGAVSPDTPVIILSGRAAEVDRLRGFELRGRIAAVTRRGRARGSELIKAGPLEIDLRSRSVMLDGRRINLTGKEFSLLAQLARDPGRVFTKRELLTAVWGHPDGGSTRTLDSHVCRLRRKLGAERCMIVNVWGTGYRLFDADQMEIAP
jgi:DNA-binding response OmpR family regulator